MTQTQEFTPSELKVIEQLIQGKSNKQIAAALSLAESTVEFHLGHIYTKLGVASRTEAILQLGKSIVPKTPGESIVAEEPEMLYAHKEKQSISNRKRSVWIVALGVVVLFVIALLVMSNISARPWAYEREAEFPDELTVGQDLDRSNASGTKVHGQFGSEGFEPWSPKPGFVRYVNIEIPINGELYLQVRYSKFSKSVVPILVNLDNETEPRASFYPLDQGDWNAFTQSVRIMQGDSTTSTEVVWIALGEIRKGKHSITFSTEGQEFGVADLDKFTLTTEPPN